MKTAAVIVATWRNERWIMECVDSIRAQEPYGWTVDLRIGVDGCEATSQVLQDHGVGHWYSETNVGPYLIRNSLIAQEPADVYVIFDADDVMTEGFLAELLPRVGDGIAGPSRRECNEALEHLAGPFGWVNGVAAYSHEAMTKLGGFRPWRIAADHDAVHRAKAMRIPIKRAPEAVYFRRKHPAALTEARETHLRSRQRKMRKTQTTRLTIQARRRPERLYVVPETVELEERRAGLVAV